MAAEKQGSTEPTATQPSRGENRSYWFKFYRQQWLGNIRLRSCSPEARALLIDLMAMSDGDGHLRLTLAAISRFFGESQTALTVLIEELRRNGVLNTAPGSDVIVFRTIARDNTFRVCGMLGGRPDLKKGGGSRGGSRGGSTSLLSLISDSEKKQKRAKKANGEVLLEDAFKTLAGDPAFLAAWGEWLAYREEIHAPYKPVGMRSCLRQVLELGVTAWIAASRHSMASGWRGIFPDRSAVKRIAIQAPKTAREAWMDDQSRQQASRLLRSPGGAS